jgi:hypothetical protein
MMHDCRLGGDDTHGKGRRNCRDERVYSLLVVVYNSTDGLEWGMMGDWESRGSTSSCSF